MSEDTSIKVDTIEIKIAEEKDTTTKQNEIGHIDSSIPTTQEQGANQVIVI